MSRLIDADEVKKYIHDLMLNNVDRYTDKEMTQYDNLIDSCRTVKAIPVECIKKWAYQLLEDGKTTAYFEILDMLENWEKENDSK